MRKILVTESQYKRLVEAVWLEKINDAIEDYIIDNRSDIKKLIRELLTLQEDTPFITHLQEVLGMDFPDAVEAAQFYFQDQQPELFEQMESSVGYRATVAGTMNFAQWRSDYFKELGFNRNIERLAKGDDDSAFYDLFGDWDSENV